MVLFSPLLKGFLGGFLLLCGFAGLCAFFMKLAKGTFDPAMKMLGLTLLCSSAGYICLESAYTEYKRTNKIWHR